MTQTPVYLSGLPPINVDERGIRDMLDSGTAVRSAVHVNTDPITGVAMFEVYHDDGHGNGFCILAVPVAELKMIARRFSEMDAAA